MSGDDTISPDTFNLVSQNAHWLFGSWFTLVPVYIWGVGSLYYTIPFLLLFVIIKEAWYDEKYENKATRGSGLLDATMYILGMIITLCIVMFQYHKR